MCLESKAREPKRYLSSKPDKAIGYTVRKYCTYSIGLQGEHMTAPAYLQAHMSVTRGLQMFKEKTTTAMEGEVRSLLVKKTFTGVDVSGWPYEKKTKILRSIMNIVEKYHPTVDDNGERSVDKVKARLCVDGRTQERSTYRPQEIESVTASIAAIYSIAQLAAAEGRFTMVGDVGSAYLDASMPTDDPDKIL